MFEKVDFDLDARARPSLELLMTLSADFALHFACLREGILEDEATDQHGGWGMRVFSAACSDVLLRC